VARNIEQWLEAVGLAKYSEVFAQNEVDLAALRHLDEDDLKELGLPLGPRKKLIAAISDLGPIDAAPSDAVVTAREAERRQLTVMFVDLVGSTALAARLDPEDLRDVIQRYQNTVAGEVARYEGHVAKFMGDGVLVYFGYPRAHEDEAERAVRAGLGIVAAMDGKTAAGERLQVRIGVATGQVVVGDLVGQGAAQEEAVIGETPNLAARLQALAEPDSVVVAQATRDLLGGLFEVKSLRSRKLAGFAERVKSWRVLGERTVGSRFEASHGGGLNFFVGRSQELSLLKERWTRAREGEGQVVLLTGEAGIGKSRLTRALMEFLAAKPHTRLRYQCSPHHVNSALHPFIAQLERAAGFEAADDVGAKRAKLDRLLTKASDKTEDITPLIASLLSIPSSDVDHRQELEPQRRKQLTFRALLDQLTGLAERAPVLVIFEDVHWADPTSLELLEQMVDCVQEARVLAVITGRPEFEPAWHGHSHITTLSLNRLGRRHGSEIVAGLTGGKTLPDDVLDQIVARTDGVPLFVEELTKSVLESNLLEDTGDRYLLKGELQPLAIPSTLRDSLMARLDRLVPVREVAQIASAVGREVPYRLLAQVSTLNDEKLAEALDQLVRSDLLFCRGSLPEATYIFRHSLMQDTAYGSLLRDKRRAIHQRIATALEAAYPERAETEPEVLAHHYTEGGIADRAIACWQRAAQRATERSADAEAQAHLQKATRLLEAIPDVLERRRTELEILIILGPVLMNVRNTASREVREAYLRARQLCEQVGRPSQLFPVLWGLWLHHQISGRFDLAAGLAQEAIELAESLSNNDFLLQARHAAWTSRMGLADFDSVITHADQGLVLYDLKRHRTHAFTYGGHDPGVCAATQSAHAKWFLGYPEQSEKRTETALEIARRLNHPISMAQALAFTAMVRLLRREPERALPLGDELIAFSAENDLRLWRANGRIIRAWALSEMGSPSQALNDFRAGIQERLTAGSQIRISLQLAAMADALARIGEAGEAQITIAQALEQVEKTGERTYESIVHWFKGRIIAVASGSDTGEAESCYRLAGELARQRGAKSVELRAAIGLAGLLFKQGQNENARKLLAPVYEWFTEGFDTPDLKDATALLKKLS
jgi:class 3 adenylate cyclase/predicted ATPase